jgi:hypothetical protein
LRTALIAVSAATSSAQSSPLKPFFLRTYIKHAFSLFICSSNTKHKNLNKKVVVFFD